MKQKLLLLLAVCVASVSLAQPVVTKNPISQSLCLDTCTVLKVNAVGDGLTYQWELNDGSSFASIIGGTDDTFLLCLDVMPGNASAQYRCVVTDNNGNSVTSNAAVVSYDSCSSPIADFSFSYDQAVVCFTNKSKHADEVIWNFGNDVTDNSNNNNPCNDYTTAWYYDVTLYAINDYGTDKKTLTLDLVGIEELDTRFELFPNPTAGMMTLVSPQVIDRILLVDVQGRTVFESTPNSNRAQINFISQGAGVYSMLIESEGKWMQQKVVKQ